MIILRRFAFLLFVSLFSTTALAQGNDALARRLVDQGVVALQSEDWKTAQDRFTRAYELSPNVLTLYNLGVAQMNGGNLVEADESFRQFLRDVGPGEHTAFREEAERSRSSLKQRVAHLTVKVEKFRPSLRVTLNNKEFATAALGERLTVNPGEHRIVVSESGKDIADKSTTLGEGATGILKVNVPPPSPQEAARLATTNEDKSVAPFESAKPKKKSNTGVIVGVLVGILVVAGVITAVALVTSKDSRDPFQGNLPSFTLN